MEDERTMPSKFSEKLRVNTDFCAQPTERRGKHGGRGRKDMYFEAHRG